ncbi:MAG: hypothetical protein HC836_45085 [Richelia sp. RM2_1_2]|nr:hypothetical protein [Richelia sp. SM1_7_0]NJN13802.1 hypothetical protein [Richelia sp. RM1_1_1]NJO65036.1 hypothetical protein [Richelia sp. RM2_1_2]
MPRLNSVVVTNVAYGVVVSSTNAGQPDINCNNNVTTPVSYTLPTATLQTINSNHLQLSIPNSGINWYFATDNIGNVITSNGAGQTARILGSWAANTNHNIHVFTNQGTLTFGVE